MIVGDRHSQLTVSWSQSRVIGSLVERSDPFHGVHALSLLQNPRLTHRHTLLWLFHHPRPRLTRPIHEILSDIEYNKCIDICQ